jgi:RNA polymerase sigma-54 factor
MAFTQDFTDETVERDAERNHELEPSGVGARDLQECFYLFFVKHKTPS